MKRKSIAAVVLALALFGTGPAVIFAAGTDSGVSGTESAETDLAAQLAELQAQIDALKKENEELKGKTEESKTAESGSAEGTEPADGSAGESAADPAQELPPEIANADTTVEYTDTVTVQYVQIALNAAGYNCGAADGKAGKNTRAQIEAYETDHSLVVNGIITDQLIQSLGIADKVAENAKKEAMKASYTGEYTYDQLARTPEAYRGVKVKYSGEVVQAMEEGSDGALRVAINSNYDQIIYVYYDTTTLDFRVLDDDMVTVYGTAQGVYSYSSVGAGQITIPFIEADIVELQ